MPWDSTRAILELSFHEDLAVNNLDGVLLHGSNRGHTERPAGTDIELRPVRRAFDHPIREFTFRKANIGVTTSVFERDDCPIVHLEQYDTLKPDSHRKHLSLTEIADRSH